MWRLILLASLLAVVSGCPHYCRCYTDQYDRKAANCSISALSNIQAHNLNVLNVGSMIRGTSAKLEPRMFQHLHSLKYLNIRNSSFSQLPNGVFHGLDSVFEVDLSFNKIRHLNGVVFRDLRSLVSLVLRGNPLVLSPFDVIVSQTLEEIDMSLCGLSEIPTDTFLSVGKLMRLNLEDNNLVTFGYVFPATLHSLNLRKNSIVNVPTDVLMSMRNLGRIDLSDNPINCTCHLLIFQDRFSDKAGIFENEVICAAPPQYFGQRLNRIDENELCLAEHYRRGSQVNAIKHRGYKTHRRGNYIYDPLAIQGDQPYSSSETGIDDAEVLYANDETRALGTHMEDEFQSEESYKEPESYSSEMQEPHQDLTKPDPSVETNTHSIDKLEDIDSFDEKGSGEVDTHSESNRESMDNAITSKDVFDASNTIQSSVIDNTTSSSETPDKADFPWPSTATASPDYNYDTQHDDYTVFEYTTTTKPDDHEDTTEFEGSGEEEVVSSSSIQWIEEQEGESTTESYQVQNVSEILPGENATTELPTTESTTVFEVSSEEPTTRQKTSTPTTEFTTDASTTVEAEIYKEGASIEHKEKERIVSRISDDPEESLLKSYLLYIVFGVLVILVSALILIMVCKRRRTGKIRLPPDPESEPGTEMQNMLIPKPPENGVKILPKHTNGSTPANGKSDMRKDAVDEEEITPVLTTRDEPSWELDKPEPIEAVTARLTVLARPQTPVFIHKTIN